MCNIISIAFHLVYVMIKNIKFDWKYRNLVLNVPYRGHKTVIISVWSGGKNFSVRQKDSKVSIFPNIEQRFLKNKCFSMNFFFKSSIPNEWHSSYIRWRKIYLNKLINEEKMYFIITPFPGLIEYCRSNFKSTWISNIFSLWNSPETFIRMFTTYLIIILISI